MNKLNWVVATIVLLITTSQAQAKTLPHQVDIANHTIQNIIPLHQNPEALWRDLTDHFVDAYYAGNLTKASELAWQSLRLAKEQFGQNHLSTADSYNKLAIVTEALGDYKEADRLYSQAQKTLTLLLTPSHPSIAEILNNRANIYIIQNDYAQAEAMHRQSLIIRKQAWGESHQDVAETLYNLGYLSSLRGNNKQAIDRYQQAVQIWGKLNTPQHHHIADTYNNLSSLYLEKENWERAQEMQLKALLIRQQHLPDSWGEIAQSYLSLGAIAAKQAHFSEATLLFLEGLELLESFLGKEDPSIAIALYYLANAYHQQANLESDKRSSQQGYAAAEPLYQRALVIWAANQEENHPNLGLVFSELELLYNQMGKTEEAGLMREKVQRLSTRATH